MPPSLNIIGAGHVGRALGRLFAASGAFEVRGVLATSFVSASEAVDFIGAGTPAAGMADLGPADVWMLAVPDDQIAAVCEAVAASHALVGAVVFHCSGAKSSAELSGAASAGALAASIHPIRSFADPARVAQDFAGTWCGIEGAPGALALLEPALLAIGARLAPVDAAAKTVYHAAAVFASNYLVTVLDTALRAYVAAGIPEADARELARPLAMETLENVFRLGPEAALSGPVARGDMATVARQQVAVAGWDAGAGKLYAALADATVQLAARRNSKKIDKPA
ncbi:Rossmann-like and DUF2520 domain-containing protein [Massilia cavernae]|uniref:DUF2520 domain-containing protein n=1 Tax=Massilia cavernae TaxID=2320864 RepID=A0A418XTK5_9BURK|nr:Rossmann-like and DUF2520 domain-containing protein [Massilia cavernae]RJG15870.1 DUF2520 domain-containing protein [Massilia cavernae]